MFKQVFAKAFRDTVAYYGFRIETIIAVPVAWLAGFAVIYHWKGKAAMIDELYSTIALVIIGGVGAAAIALFIFNLIAAPYRIEKEKRLKAESALSKVTENLSHRAADNQPFIIQVQHTIDRSEADFRNGAFVSFTPSGLSIGRSENVSSVTDLGINHFMITFIDAFKTRNISCTPVGTTPRNFRVEEVTPTSMTIKFDGTDEPKSFDLWFQEVPNEDEEPLRGLILPTGTG